MSHSSVRRIVKKDLNLKTFRRREVQLLSDVDKKTRLRACQRLKVRTTADKTAQTWLSDEKLFTVQTPTNTQNDRTYAAVSNKRDVPPERLLKGRKHFSQSVVVSVALSKHGETSLVFVERGAKVTTVTTCSVATACYVTFVDCRETISSFNKMMHQHIGRGRQLPS